MRVLGAILVAAGVVLSGGCSTVLGIAAAYESLTDWRLRRPPLFAAGPA